MIDVSLRADRILEEAKDPMWRRSARRGLGYGCTTTLRRGRRGIRKTRKVAGDRISFVASSAAWIRPQNAPGSGRFLRNSACTSAEARAAARLAAMLLEGENSHD